MLELVRVGNKLISRSRIQRRVDQILEMRVAGKSQQETADALNIDRTFVSRVEALGEVRKGGRVALVAFPVQNKMELEAAAQAEGVDFVLVFTEDERQAFASSMSGGELVNEIMEMAAKLRSFDAVLFLGSDMRVEMVEAMIGKERVIGVAIGRSPMRRGVNVDVDDIVDMLRSLKH